MKLRPLGDHVVVKRVETESVSKGGIILPDTSKEKSLEAQVVAVGPGLGQGEDGNPEPLPIKPGDRVPLTKWAGNEIKLDGVEHVILRAEDILAVVNR